MLQTWQMNLGLERNDLSKSSSGVLGETFNPTLDEWGKQIMWGIEAIRGSEDDCESVPLCETSYCCTCSVDWDTERGLWRMHGGNETAAPLLVTSTDAFAALKNPTRALVFLRTSPSTPVLYGLLLLLLLLL